MAALFLLLIGFSTTDASAACSHKALTRLARERAAFYSRPMLRRDYDQVIAIWRRENPRTYWDENQLHRTGRNHQVIETEEGVKGFLVATESTEGGRKTVWVEKCASRSNTDETMDTVEESLLVDLLKSQLRYYNPPSQKVRIVFDVTDMERRRHKLLAKLGFKSRMIRAEPRDLYRFSLDLDPKMLEGYDRDQ